MLVFWAWSLKKFLMESETVMLCSNLAWAESSETFWTEKMNMFNWQRQLCQALTSWSEVAGSCLACCDCSYVFCCCRECFCLIVILNSEPWVYSWVCFTWTLVECLILRMSLKCFTMGTMVLFSAIFGSQSTLGICDSEWVTVLYSALFWISSKVVAVLFGCYRAGAT